MALESCIEIELTEVLLEQDLQSPDFNMEPITDPFVQGLASHGLELHRDFWLQLKPLYHYQHRALKVYKLYGVFRKPEHAMLAQIKGLIPV